MSSWRSEVGRLTVPKGWVARLDRVEAALTSHTTLARLTALAQSWRARIYAQGTQTEILAHEAWVLDRCAKELEAALADIVSPSRVDHYQEHLAFVAVMNALDVHMPPDGRALLRELRGIASTVGYPWKGGEGAALTPPPAAPLLKDGELPRGSCLLCGTLDEFVIYQNANHGDPLHPMWTGICAACREAKADRDRLHAELDALQREKDNCWPEYGKERARELDRTKGALVTADLEVARQVQRAQQAEQQLLALQTAIRDRRDDAIHRRDRCYVEFNPTSGDALQRVVDELTALLSPTPEAPK